MATNSFPPQAYTREILAQAYEWVKSQPSHVKDRASSADALVSLYLHARRYGNEVFRQSSPPKGSDPSSASNNMETQMPVSSQNFKEDLKNLAEGLKQFDEGEKKLQSHAPPTQTGDASSHEVPTSQQHKNHQLGDTTLSSDRYHYDPSRSEPRHYPAPSSSHATPSQPQGPAQRDTLPPHQESEASSPKSGPPIGYNVDQKSFAAYNWDQKQYTALSLDDKSLERIQEIQQRLNIQSEMEVVRMLISLGYEKLKEI